MDLRETLKLALDAIWAHKLRSFLTLLGMIIGVTAFMVVLSLLVGFSAYVDEKIAGVGSNSFTVRRFSFEDFKDTDTIAEAQRRNKELTFDELEFIKERSQLVGKIGAKALPNSREVKREGETIRDVRIEGAEPVMVRSKKSTLPRDATLPKPKTTTRCESVSSDRMLQKNFFRRAGRSAAR